MPLSLQPHLSEDELYAGLALIDPLVFRLFFFADELTLPPSYEQRLMFCDESQRVLLCTARKTAKTISVEATVLQDILLHDDARLEEGLFITPHDNHMQIFVDRLFTKIENHPVLKRVIRVRRGENRLLEGFNLRYYFKIEGMTGQAYNMEGYRAIVVRGDECAYGNWASHRSRIQTAMPGAKFLYAGVPNGVRDTPFYNLDMRQEGKNWSRHKYSSFINPLYQTDETRRQLADEYGGTTTQGYLNHVMGDWGEEVVSSFPPGSIAIRNLPYFTRQIGGIDSDKDIQSVALKLAIGSVRCHQFAIGWDYGYSPDPSTIIGAYRESEDDAWQTYCRVVMRRVALPHQAVLVQHIIEHVFIGQFVGLCCDHLSAIQEMQARDRDRARRYLWAVPAGSTKIVVKPILAEDDSEFSLSDPLPEMDEETASIRNKQFFIEKLKEWLVNAAVGLEGRKLWLAEGDPEVSEELAGTTERKTQAGYTIYYGPVDPNIKGGQLDHNRETLQHLCHAIYEGMQVEGDSASEDELLAVLGWTPSGREEWRAPWERG